MNATKSESKICKPCKRGKHATWTCRMCGRMTCRHFCNLKDDGMPGADKDKPTAICGKCRHERARIG